MLRRLKFSHVYQRRPLNIFSKINGHNISNHLSKPNRFFCTNNVTPLLKEKRKKTFLYISFGIFSLSCYTAWLLSTSMLDSVLCLNEEELLNSQKEAHNMISESKDKGQKIYRHEVIHELFDKYNRPAMNRMKLLSIEEKNIYEKKISKARIEMFLATLKRDENIINYYMYLTAYQQIYTLEQYNKILESNQKDVLDKFLLLSAAEIENL